MTKPKVISIPQGVRSGIAFAVRLCSTLFAVTHGAREARRFGLNISTGLTALDAVGFVALEPI